MPILEGGTALDLLTEFGNHSAAQVASTSTMASAMLFGAITFCSVSLAARSFFTGDVRALNAAQAPRSKPLDVNSFSSVYALLHHLTVLGGILFYAYLCEFHPPFAHSTKIYDRDEFFFLTILLILASACTWKPNDENKNHVSQEEEEEERHHLDRRNEVSIAPANAKTDVLNRAQTEEWKGWMQFVFLLYHYYHAEEAYNLVRILITSYVWMTGFGNFSFFYLKGDYGVVRLLQMLWRLNFLVLFLCLTQGTTYILYYICLLHTYYFFMVYGTMRVFSNKNYTKWGLRAKLGVVALIVAAVWDVDTGIFRLIHFPFFGVRPILGAPMGSMWEWYFRSSLDHWSTFLGMMFALNFPITSLFFRKLEAQPLMWEVAAKGAVGVALLGAFYVWFTGPFQQAKLEYNQTHAYFGFIPLVTYIYFRNLTPWLRRHSMDLLHQIGKTTLETYLLQHHIWLTSNAKSLLTLIPGWPKVNMLVVTLIYFLAARRLQRLTLYLRGIVLPDKDKKQCLRNMGILFGILFGFYALAFSLKSLGVLNLTTIGIVAIGCGALLYKACMDLTWHGFKESALANHVPTVEETVLVKMVGGQAGAPKYDTPINVVTAPLVGFLVVFTMGLVWHGMAQIGGSPIGLLPEGCEQYVNHGTWISVDPCNEESRGAGYRDFGISSFATCDATKTYVWGWNATHPSTHCRFTHRDAKSLRKALQHRTITFVGDSITRHLYHATLRQMGMASAGAYNTKVPKWADITNTIKGAVMEFEWAALATNQVEKIRDIIARPEEGVEAPEGTTATSVRPDLVIMGGGAWDRLHVYATDEDRESHRATVKELAKEIRLARASGIPIVWLVPTTINSKALLTEEKQKNIKEVDMTAMRALYDNLGVTEAASFCLDGPAWTEGRVSESYDGVHYPLSVYDAGSQILANAMDWLLPERDIEEPVMVPKPGSMANPALGIMMLCFVFMGLVCFDGFMGFSYLASFFVKGIMPSDLYQQAFDDLHSTMDISDEDDDGGYSIGMTTVGSMSSNNKNNNNNNDSSAGRSSALRNINSSRSVRSGTSGRTSASGQGSHASGNSKRSANSGKSSVGSQGSIDDEIAALLGTTSKRLTEVEDPA